MEIVFDFDGVLAEYLGWSGHHNYGKPITGMVKLAKKLKDEGHNLKLSTTRLNARPFGNEQHPDREVTKGEVILSLNKWLDENGLKGVFSVVTGSKPYGDVYIDDKAIHFDGDVGSIEAELKQLEWEEKRNTTSRD